MEIASIERRQVSDFLRQAEAEGWNWVAFDARLADHTENMIFQGFESAREAEALCSDWNTHFNVYEQDWQPADYRFLPVDNLWAAIQNPKETFIDHKATQALTGQMRSEGLRFMPGESIDSLKPMLNGELFFPLQWSKTIDPAAEADRFHVVAHQHAGHQVYEIGHSSRLVGSFDALPEAEAAFKNLIRQSTDNMDQSDYLLIAQYRNQELKLDMEGHPENYCGLTLRSAYYQYDTDLQAKAWHLQEVNQLDEPKNIRHFLYARFDLDENRLSLYDDRLQKARPQDIQQSAYPSQLLTETIMIKNVMTMNQKNFDYLKDQVKFMGFGEALNDELQKKLTAEEPKFSLEHEKEFNGQKMLTTLNFNKSKESDMYFFNSYQASTIPEGQKTPLAQTFYVNQQGDNVTLKEAYNLMNGRAVHKNEWSNRNNEKYEAWLKLDFSNPDNHGNFRLRPYNKNYGFDLNQAVDKHPIMDVVGEAKKQELLSSLQKGNRVPVTFNLDGEMKKYFIEANPSAHGLNVFDSEMRLIPNKQDYGQRQQAKQSEDQANQQKITKHQAQHH